jgi:CMP-N,N'-diacetyllegionaminic acid synthase
MNVEALKSKPLHEFAKVRKYEMDEMSSHDIDNPIDWIIAEALIQNEKI